MTQTRESGLRL